MKPNSYSTVSVSQTEQSEEQYLQTREEYVRKTNEMIISETKDLAAKIKGSSLNDEEKGKLMKISISILLNSL